MTIAPPVFPVFIRKGSLPVSHSWPWKKRIFAMFALVFSSFGEADAKPGGWQGVVAKVGGDGRVYINAGTSSGLRPGSRLVVRRAGELISDPRKHQILGREPGHFVAELALESHLGDKLSVCSVARGGRGLKIGDPVALERSAVRSGDSADDKAEGEASDETAGDHPTEPVAPPAPKPLEKKASATKVRPLRASETTPRGGRCQPGKFLSTATAGHCCWPEQLWSDRTRSCIGAPRCPSGFARQSLECVPRAASTEPEPDSE